ncbi:Nucleolar complex protein 2 [Zancudomyces culisetae]|uniref:Nucleolar complex protein 2 n=1 Tax=Zancudomyces culisetae TaxID=1213189 RepID=A0A1R1PZ37_ZANCU|nr:Nucleolar complex protein 2 [Zancudomyces culisetae]|eukprot:OMH86206.1 Nucleolar complex protein 2 [Zancudomyces culisetae]
MAKAKKSVKKFKQRQTKLTKVTKNNKNNSGPGKSTKAQPNKKGGRFEKGKNAKRGENENKQVASRGNGGNGGNKKENKVKIIDELEEFVSEKGPQEEMGSSEDEEMDNDGEEELMSEELSEDSEEENDKLFESMDVEEDQKEYDSSSDSEPDEKEEKKGGKGIENVERKEDEEEDDEDDEEEDDEEDEEEDEEEEDDDEEHEEEDQEEARQKERRKKVKEAKKTNIKEAKNLKSDMDKLKEKDPEFYEFMKENDPDALDFAIESEDDDDEDGDKIEEGTTIITNSMLQKWEKEMEGNSKTINKKILHAFKSASTKDEKEKGGLKQKYLITNPQVFHRLMKMVVDKFPQEIQAIPEKDNQKRRGEMVRTYMVGLLRNIQQIADDEMVAYMIRQSRTLARDFGMHAKASREFVKEMLRLYGARESSEEVSKEAAGLLGEMVNSGEIIKDVILKGVYLSYVRHSNVTGIHSIAKVEQMRQSAVELYTTCNDYNSVYSHAFMYIRQLAVGLRAAMHLNTKDAYQKVYNWQFVNSLKFWADLLSHSCGGSAPAAASDALEPLIYPLIQVVLGVSKLIPTAKYFPLCLHCIEILTQLSASTRIYIPVLPLVISIIQSPDFTSKKRPAKAVLKQINLELYIKCPKQYEHTAVYLDCVLDRLLLLLTTYLRVYSNSVAFDSLVIPLVVVLKKWKKLHGRNFTKFSTMLTSLLDKINANTTFILSQPCDLPSTDPAFLYLNHIDPDSTPVGKYALSLSSIHNHQKSILLDSSSNS